MYYYSNEWHCKTGFLWEDTALIIYNYDTQELNIKTVKLISN